MRAGTDDDRQLQLFTILHIKKQSVHYRILRSYKDTLHGPSGEIRTPGILIPNLCLNLQAELSRTLWRFPSLLRFLFETLLPCLFQTQLSSFEICVGLNSVY